MTVITDEQATELVQAALNQVPRSLDRQLLTHSGNAIFKVGLVDDQTVVLRVSPKPRAFGFTAQNLDAIQAFSVPVQRVLASGPAPSGGSFIILNWLSGQDLVHELPRMSRTQMACVAEQIVQLQRNVGTLRPSKGFGWAPVGKDASETRWTDIFGSPDVTPIPSNASAVDQLRARLRVLRHEVEPYFETVKPICFLDDLTIKNVLIENGELSGIIDVDFFGYGDPLMSVGTTLALLAVEVGEAGQCYGEELLRLWNPSDDAHQAIWFYAALWSIGLMNTADELEKNRLVPIADALLRRGENWSVAREQVMTPEQLLVLATARHRAGNLADAGRLYREVLRRSPHDNVAKFRLGLLEFQEGHLEEALALIVRCATAAPGELRYQLGLGQILQAMQRWKPAAAVFCRATELDPRSADAWISLGNVLIAMGELDQAIQPLRSGIALDPQAVSPLVNLSAALCSRRDYAEAAGFCRRALELDKDNVDAIYNLGTALKGQGLLREAIEQFAGATSLKPDHAEAWNAMGTAYKELGEFQHATASYDRALVANPGFTSAINNSGCLLRTLGKLGEAETMLRRGLVLAAGHPALWDNLGNVLKDSGRLDEAIECFRTALLVDPTNSATHSNLLYSLSFRSTDASEILREGIRWNQQHAAVLQPEVRQHQAIQIFDRRIRVGYVSPDFRDHCQSLFTIPLLSNHNHERFEIFCYCSVERPDTITRRISAYADQWRDVRTLDDLTLCKRIEEDGIDILVDLTMHMADGRPLVFARKPALLQVAWLAYPGTTGIPAMDYRLSDPRLDPLEFDSHYTERTIRLPDSFWCYDPLTDQLEANSLPAVSAGCITFGCLNNPCKLSDHTLRLWGYVMQSLPDARVTLMAPAGSYRRHLLNRLAAHGISEDRVSFLSFRPRADYLRSYHEIDLGLDTFPYNGHTTTLDSLWMGVPVVTRVGPTCVGRGGLSQLFQLDLADLACERDDAFIAAAVALAKDLPRLAQLRRELRPRLEQSPLMDAKRFAANIEAAYVHMLTERNLPVCCNHDPRRE